VNSALFNQMYTALTEAQEERPNREEVINGELDWITYERTVMLNTVNAARAARFLPPLTVDEIERVEMSATGHVDYTKKFALYCAELAAGQQR
jgi:hypothetical protein